jgi:WD40 repeat protein
MNLRRPPRLRFRDIVVTIGLFALWLGIYAGTPTLGSPETTCGQPAALDKSVGQTSTNGNISPVPNVPTFPDLTVAKDGASVVADCPGGICTWDATSGSITSRARRYGVLSPDLSQIAQAGSAGKIDLVSLDTGNKLLTLAGHPQPEATDQISNITGLVYSPDGQTLASAASTDCGVKLWNTKTGELRGTFNTSTGTITDLEFSADGTRLALSGREVGAQVWDLRSHRRIAIAAESSTTFDGLAFSPDGHQVALIDSATPTKVNVYDANTFELKYTAPTSGSASSPIFDPTGNTLAYTMYPADRIVLWQPGSATALSLKAAHPARVAFSPDGQVLYSASSYLSTQPEQLLAWNTATGRLLRRFDLP